MNQVERFFNQLDKNGPDGCWVWMGGKTAAGYGELMFDGHVVYAHRVSYELANGPIPSNMVLDHGPVCHRRDCVNPDHVRIATPGENACNQRKRKDNTSGFKGVSWNTRERKWIALITRHGTTKQLGTFEKPEDAHVAYCNAAAKVHGQFANPGTN